MKSMSTSFVLGCLLILCVTVIVQIAVLAQTPSAPFPTTARIAQAQKFYADTFNAIKEQAAKPCKDAGGKLWVMVSQVAGQLPTTSVSCEMK